MIARPASDKCKPLHVQAVHWISQKSGIRKVKDASLRNPESRPVVQDG